MSLILCQLSVFLNQFASEALGLGLYVYFMWNLPGLMAGAGKTKVCSDGLDHVTKPATMSIHGKTLLKSPSDLKSQ